MFPTDAPLAPLIGYRPVAAGDLDGVAIVPAAMPGGLALWTHGDNRGAAAFYAKVGMTLIGPGTHPRHGHPILTYAFGPVDA